MFFGAFLAVDSFFYLSIIISWFTKLFFANLFVVFKKL